MTPHGPEDYGLLTWIWVFGISILGGTVRTLTNLNMGMTWQDLARRWIIDIIVSAFIGIVTFSLCEYAQFNQMLTAAVVGISAHMGTRAIIIIEELGYSWFKKIKCVEGSDNE